MYGKMIKLRHLKSGELVEKTVINWRNLPNDLKAEYTVLEDGEALPAVNTPAEVKDIDVKWIPTKEFGESKDETGNSDKDNTGNEKEPAKRGRKPKV